MGVSAILSLFWSVEHHKMLQTAVASTSCGSVFFSPFETRPFYRGIFLYFYRTSSVFWREMKSCSVLCFSPDPKHSQVSTSGNLFFLLPRWDSYHLLFRSLFSTFSCHPPQGQGYAGQGHVVRTNASVENSRTLIQNVYFVIGCATGEGFKKVRVLSLWFLWGCPHASTSFSVQFWNGELFLFICVL